MSSCGCIRSSRGKASPILLVYLSASSVLLNASGCFSYSQLRNGISSRQRTSLPLRYSSTSIGRSSYEHGGWRTSQTALKARSDEEDLDDVEEEARLNVLKSRRQQIRSTLKNAEALQNFRLQNGYVPELDDDGKPIKSDSKAALSIAAFFVAAGAVLLRVGGRAALVSTLGLDFANDNPELKENLDTFLNYAASLDTTTEAALFILAWTAVKVFCFDAGGIVLAFASGILFGGVIQGAVFCALAATIGSSVAFGLAKLDTPVRKKALEIVEEYPYLRGIEKVVARDGLKAILVLRLSPILPIPIGMYNYVYGKCMVAMLTSSRYTIYSHYVSLVLSNTS